MQVLVTSCTDTSRVSTLAPQFSILVRSWHVARHLHRKVPSPRALRLVGNYLLFRKVAITSYPTTIRLPSLPGGVFPADRA
jgi:hypothetical protein